MSQILDPLDPTTSYDAAWRQFGVAAIVGVQFIALFACASKCFLLAPYEGRKAVLHDATANDLENVIGQDVHQRIP